MISRANEQIKVDICYNNTNVKLFGLNAGASYGPLASTHHSIDDISVLRGFGNIEIYAPPARWSADRSLSTPSTTLVRCISASTAKALPELHDESYRFAPGNIDVLRTGKDIALVAMGSTVHEIVEAATQLAAEGIDASVISVPSIRPCNTSQLLALLQPHRAVISVEEHNINGGVGSPGGGSAGGSGLRSPLAPTWHRRWTIRHRRRSCRYPRPS